MKDKDQDSTTERLLAMILVQTMGEAPNNTKAMALSRAGVANKDIAALLGTTEGSVTQALYELRKGKARKPPSKKK